MKLRNRTSSNDLRINDVLDVSCQSGPARPATKLQFFINDLAISQAYANLTETVHPIVQEDDEFAEVNEIYRNSGMQLLDTPTSSNQELNDYQLMNSLSKDINHQSNSLILFKTTLRLRIRLRQSLLLKTKKSFNLRCASYVTHLFVKSSEHVFQVLQPPVDYYLSNDLSTSVSSNRKKSGFFKNFNKKTFGPFIDNTRSNYAIGDLINVTCFTGPTKPPAYLQWFIEDKEAPHQYLRIHKPIETKDGLRSLLGLEFRLSEDFLADQQQFTTTSTTTTVQSIELNNNEYNTFQDLDELANQSVRLINKKREIKLKCVAQLSKIVHVRSRQFQIADQAKLGITTSRSMINDRLADELLLFYSIFLFYSLFY